MIISIIMVCFFKKLCSLVTRLSVVLALLEDVQLVSLHAFHCLCYGVRVSRMCVVFFKYL